MTRTYQLIIRIAVFSSLTTAFALYAAGQLFPLRKTVVVQQGDIGNQIDFAYDALPAAGGMIVPASDTPPAAKCQTSTVSIIAEKVRCDKAGGTFEIGQIGSFPADYVDPTFGNDYGSWYIKCLAKTPADVFDYDLKTQ